MLPSASNRRAEIKSAPGIFRRNLHTQMYQQLNDYTKQNANDSSHKPYGCNARAPSLERTHQLNANKSTKVLPLLCFEFRVSEF